MCVCVVCVCACNVTGGLRHAAAVTNSAHTHAQTNTQTRYTPQRYKWDEPSREAIEAAFDTLLQTHYKQRQKLGFSPPGLRGRGGPRDDAKPSLVGRVKALFDPTVTMRTIINEGAVFGAFALW